MTFEDVRSELITVLENYLNTVYESSEKAEIPIIRNMHKNISQLGTEWNQILKQKLQRNLYMTSFFTHQYPQVEFYNGTKCCEIGDLLYIHLDVLKSGEVNKQSLLLQAKVTNPCNKNENQKELYTTWPEITFRVPNNGGTFNVLPKKSHDGARYLIINNEIEDLSPINRFQTDNTYDLTKGSRSFINELVDLLDFKSGRALEKDTWSNTIEVVEKYATENIYGQKDPLPRKNQLLFIDHDKGRFKKPLSYIESDSGLLVILMVTADNPIQLEAGTN